MIPSPELGNIQGHEGEPSRQKRKGKQVVRNATSEAQKEMENKKMESWPAHRKAPTATEESHIVSTAIDDMTVEEVQKLRKYVILTVVKGFAGLRPHEKVKEEVAALVAPGLKWTSQPFEDGRILLHCPSEDLARRIESLGEMIFSSFTVRCEPCPAATNATGKADGEVRWITATGLPIFCRRRDMIARMLKPVGDLVYLAKSGAFFVGTCKAAVRIRRGRKLPTTVKYNALTEQFTIRIQLDRGEPPLPWDKPPETPTASSGAKGDGNQPVNSEKWCGPPGNNQKLQAEVTAEEMGFRRSPADAIACDAAQSVRTLAGYKGKEKVDIRSKTNMEIREFKEKTKEKENSQMGERQRGKNALMAPSHQGKNHVRGVVEIKKILAAYLAQRDMWSIVNRCLSHMKPIV
ncbi:hypothetical protein J5N97_011276 [Dioscorea zingiberensis]|uniref:Uncharacterized protein n=1 Tax=Dioscorea zingiberensis TaxID=325984 RepID=A0A9D5D0R0_9LILI|nr:hypothetical protein J5N97_011276 [Dioscorea zingiberensis]